jgi:dTDP-glucose pyrophosphorylase
MLEMALETLDKYLTENPIEKLVAKSLGNEICQSKDFGKIKDDITQLVLVLFKQFKNAEKEFTSAQFLQEIKVKDPEDEKEVKLKKKKSIKEKPKEKTPNWYCNQCTFFNQDIPGIVCSVCNKEGRKDEYEMGDCA